MLAAWANEQTVLAAWAGYEEDEIPDRSGPVLIGRCEVTIVVRQNFSESCLWQSGHRAVFGSRAGQARICGYMYTDEEYIFNSTFQTFGLEQLLFLGGKLYAVENRIEK